MLDAVAKTWDRKEKKKKIEHDIPSVGETNA